MTIFDNTEAFGLMDKALQDEMKAWKGGHLIYTIEGKWEALVPSYDTYCVYRAIPAPLTKPSVDWNILSEKVAGIARDEDGDIHAFLRATACGVAVWLCTGDDWRIDGLLPSVTPGTCDWRESWVDNPRYKP